MKLAKMWKKYLCVAIVCAILGALTFLVIQDHTFAQEKRAACTEIASATVQDIAFAYNSARVDVQKNYGYIFSYEIDGVEYQDTEVVLRTVPIEHNNLIGTDVTILYNPNNHQEFIVADESATILYDQVIRDFYKPNIYKIILAIGLLGIGAYATFGIKDEKEEDKHKVKAQ